MSAALGGLTHRLATAAGVTALARIEKRLVEGRRGDGAPRLTPR